MYLRGPYSPDLAHDLFALEEKKLSATPEPFATDELEERFLQLNSFLKGKSVRQLELISTLHWFEKVAGYSEENAERKLRVWKEVNDKELEETKKNLEVLPA